MHPSIIMYQQIRRTMNGAVKRLTPEQWLAIPPGFDNNIAWNIGHVVTVQQSLLYRLSGLPMSTDKSFARRFRPGTSPADWASPPDVELLRERLKSSAMQLMADFEANKFQQFTPYETSTRFSIQNFDQSLAFCLFHEGLHLGTILSIRNYVL